jgi:hypothetical protein
VQGVAQCIQDGAGVLVAAGFADTEQDRGVVVAGPQVAGGGEVRGLGGVDGDVEPDGAAHEKPLGNMSAQQVGHDAVGGGESEEAWGGGDDVGGGAQGVGVHGCSPFRAGVWVRRLALGVGDRRGGGVNPAEPGG